VGLHSAPPGSWGHHTHNPVIPQSSPGKPSVSLEKRCRHATPGSRPPGSTFSAVFLPRPKHSRPRRIRAGAGFSCAQPSKGLLACTASAMCCSDFITPRQLRLAGFSFEHCRGAHVSPITSRPSSHRHLLPLQSAPPGTSFAQHRSSPFPQAP